MTRIAAAGVKPLTKKFHDGRVLDARGQTDYLVIIAEANAQHSTQTVLSRVIDLDLEVELLLLADNLEDLVDLSYIKVFRFRHLHDSLEQRFLLFLFVGVVGSFTGCSCVVLVQTLVATNI